MLHKHALDSPEQAHFEIAAQFRSGPTRFHFRFPLSAGQRGRHWPGVRAEAAQGALAGGRCGGIHTLHNIHTYQTHPYLTGGETGASLQVSPDPNRCP